MKRMILTVLVVIVFSTASSARKFVAEGKTFSALGNFKIEIADQPFVLNGVELNTYVITFVVREVGFTGRQANFSYRF